jgi:methionine biosynthesis protein MetW
MEYAKPLVYDRIIGDSLSPSLRLISDLVTPGSRVLDVGCASGYFGQHLREDKHCSVTGVDYSSDAVEVARLRGIEAYAIDLEREPLDSAGFDAVIFADVLEHIRNPEEVLASVVAPRILVSLPNIGHWSARRQLIRGRFPMDDSGLFDRTHIHFFTQTTARGLVEGAGFRIIRQQFNPDRLPFERRVPALMRLRRPAVRLFPGLFAFQFIFDAAQAR